MKYITEEQLENLLENNGLDDYSDCDFFGWDTRTLEVSINGKYYGVEYYMDLDDYLNSAHEVYDESEFDTFEDWIEYYKDEFMTDEELKGW
jgi:hypothetical protein